MRIRYAADIHQHNDYLSGICELPARGYGLRHVVNVLGGMTAFTPIPTFPLQGEGVESFAALGGSRVYWRL
jgi:hypothetical protein